jgi:hypothetical protein
MKPTAMELCLVQIARHKRWKAAPLDVLGELGQEFAKMLDDIIREAELRWRAGERTLSVLSIMEDVKRSLGSMSMSEEQWFRLRWRIGMMLRPIEMYKLPPRPRQDRTHCGSHSSLSLPDSLSTIRRRISRTEHTRQDHHACSIRERLSRQHPRDMPGGPEEVGRLASPSSDP